METSQKCFEDLSEIESVLSLCLYSYKDASKREPGETAVETLAKARVSSAFSIFKTFTSIFHSSMEIWRTSATIRHSG